MPFVKPLEAVSGRDAGDKSGGARGGSASRGEDVDFDLPALHGPQGMTDEDTDISGLRTQGPRGAARHYRTATAAGAGPLPMFTRHPQRVSAAAGGRPIAKVPPLAGRLRPIFAGYRGKGFSRILHPRDLLTKRGEITEENPTRLLQDRRQGPDHRPLLHGNGETKRVSDARSARGDDLPTTDPRHPARNPRASSSRDRGGCPRLRQRREPPTNPT